MFGFNGRRFSGWMALGALIALQISVAQAQSTTYPFDLPAQPLAESLRAVGHQTSTNVMFEPRLVRNLHAPALRTQTTTAEAIRLLLEGTQLSAVQTAPDSILIRAARTDVGDAADSSAEWSPNKSYGLGARYKTPAGPLALDVAYADRDRKVRLSFSVTVAF